MPNHRTEIVKQEQPNNECVSVTIRCCGDAITDETFTLYGVHALTAEQIAAQIEQHHDAVAQKHAGMQAGKKHLEGLLNRSKNHVPTS